METIKILTECMNKSAERREELYDHNKVDKAYFNGEIEAYRYAIELLERQQTQTGSRILG